MRFPALLPQTLVGRVFALYAVNLTLFFSVGLGFLYYNQFAIRIEAAQDAALVLSEVVAQTVTDSVVIGDYDTVKRTLTKAIQHSPFSDAAFVDVNGGSVAAFQHLPANAPPPAWLTRMVAGQLHDINSVIAVGGHDYGVLRLRYAPGLIADDIWAVTQVVLEVGVVALLIGLLLISVLLRRWLGGLDGIRELDPQGPLPGAEKAESGALGAPREIRAAMDAFRRAGVELEIRRETAAVTLNAIADGVITTDAMGRILFANPAAERTLGSDIASLQGLELRSILPDAFEGNAADEPLAGWSGRRINLDFDPARPMVIDTTLSAIVSGAGETIGHVFVWRDVTAAQRYADRLREELQIRQAALGELRDALAGMLPAASLGQFAVAPDDLGAVSRLVAQLVRERESNHRALAYQKLALDEHASVTIADAEFRITYANAKFCALTGYAVDEVIGMDIRSRTLAGPQPREHYDSLLATIRAGRVWHGELANRRKDGNFYWVSATIVPWLDDSGVPYQYIAIRTDITAQRMTEEALAEARRRELETGHAIQRALLIGDLPGDSQVAEVASYTEPSQGIDGDFFSFTTFRSNCLELLAGDVMGKGVPAALVGAAVRSGYNQVVTELVAASLGSRELPSPADIVNALHRRLTPRLIELDTFVTLALYRFDFDYAGGTLRFVNAGHTAGLLIRAGGGVDRMLGDNLPVGVLPDECYAEQVEVVDPGDALLVYSDGITEARNDAGEEFGEERLREFAAATVGHALPTSIFLQALRRSVRAFAGEQGMTDDQTAVLVGLRPPPGDATAPAETFDLPWDAGGFEPLRARVAAAAAPLGDAAADGLVLAAFEAATNVVRHVTPGIPQATLACRILADAAGVALEIWYLGEPFVPETQVEPDFSGESTGGFGIFIMQNAVTSVAYRAPLPGVCCTRLTQAVQDAVAA